MEANLDDPPENHDQNNDAQNTCSLSKELDNQTGETAYNDRCDQDDTQSGESGTDNSQTESKSPEKSPCKMQQGAIFSGKILSFCCSECKGDTTYSPNDLLKHFQGAHKGTLPTYPCDLCTFVTNEFSSLQRHRIGHRDTLVTCEICNDGVQYSLLFLTRHFIMCHSCNGLFRCKTCDFSTRDAGTFVQHIHHHNEGSHKCIKCPPLSPTQGKVHSGTFPFTCQFCGYGAARREYLNKHLAVAHGDEVERTNRWRAIEDNTGVNSPGLKLLLKKSPSAGGSRESQWMTKLNSLPGVGLLDHNGSLFNPEKTLEETQQFLERAVSAKKDGNKWSKGSLKSEPQSSLPVTTPTQTKTQENELGSGSGVLHPSNSNGLTVLMVKNKISIPPNCTTKVMGFKMVDGKKHLVLKVIPTKQEPSAKNEMSTTDVAGEDEKTSSFPCSTLSPRSKSLLSLDSGIKKGFTASIKLEAQDTDNFTRDQSPLLDEHEADLDRTNTDTSQIGDEALIKSSTLFNTPSASPPCVDLESIMTEQYTFSNSHSPHLARLSSQLDEELSPSPPTITKSKSTNSTTRDPDATETKISHTEVHMAKPTPAESFVKPTTAVDLDMEEVSQSESIEDDPTSPEVVSNMKSVSISECHASPSALDPNCIADEGTTPTVSDEFLSQIDHLKDNKQCSVESVECCSVYERMTEQSSPRSPVNMSASSLSIAEERQTPDVDVRKTSLSKDTEIITRSSNLSDGKSSPSNSFTGVKLPNDSSPIKELAFDNIVVNSVSSTITPNGEALSDTSSQHKTCSGESPNAKDCNTEVETLLQNSPSQEVFSFHNYSKETLGISPDSMEADEGSPEDLEEDEGEDFGDLKLAPDWSLTLSASPPLVAAESEEGVGTGVDGSGGGDDIVSASGKKALERVSDSDIEVDECIATVDDSLSVPVLPETEKEAACLSESGENGEQDVSPVVEKGAATLTNAAVLGKILEKHSDAIISQQLEKERMVSSTATQEPVRPAKTTLRILQTPEGKQQMFLQTTETPYAVPVQLKSAPGFKLITKSCASKVNVSYVNPGIERPSKGTGLSLTLNGGRIGMSTQGSSGEGKSQSSFLQAVSSSGGRYFVNASSLKGPLLLSSAVKSPSGEPANVQPTCFLVQRPLPVAPVSSESTGLDSKTVLTTHPVLAMPVNSADKTAPLQTGRQAYLVRYISPAKSGILLNGSHEKGASQGSQANGGGKSRVFLKIVRSPNGTRFLSTAPYPSAKKPIYLAAGSLQSPYILMSPNRPFTSLSAGLKTSNTPHGPSHKVIPAKLKNILPQSSIDNKNRGRDSLSIQTSPLVPMHTRPRSQRKRRRRALFEELFETSPKTRRISSKATAEKEVVSLWEPAAKDVERTLRLSPFSPLQQIKWPRQNQPVVVLNHPDADIPQVADIMKSVNRYKNEVVKVSLSQNTVKAISEWSLLGLEGTLSKQDNSSNSLDSRVQPIGRGNVRERFILKLKLKKTSRNKYQVVRLSSAAGSEQKPTFSCWFCGRVFNNQEEWIGHGQRHLMEATRDWNKLF
ncbi:zinc finger protein 518A [Brachyhypopomus gauderio]|uniref:zinc finger protein 518A n=1 Tax=Brachyhypopomus gauderio TaxID=698409 RepID=UPI00404273F7